MSHACLDCLARARLLDALAARLERLADRTQRPVRELLGRTNAELLDVTRTTGSERERVLAAARSAAHEDSDRALDGGAVCIHSEGYPERLRDLSDPPHALFHTGPFERLARLAGDRPVAVVGSRRASDHGLEAAYQLGRGLASAGVTVVSGLAFGIDAACHRGALAGGGAAIAVLASGADRSSPAGNRSLYAELRQVGSVVSEMPWGAKPRRWLFPARNRIMAALSQMTVVVEAAARSGSLITADFATQLGRDVGAMPGAPGARLTGGNNALLRAGGAVIRDAGDVLDELYHVGAAPRRQADGGRVRIAGEPLLLELLDAVEVGVPLEQMSDRLGVDARKLRTALVRLERIGLIRRVGLRGYVATTIG